MKFLLLIAAILAIAMFIHMPSLKQDDAFKSWMKEYRRVYASEEIEQYRRTVFVANQEKIAKTNARQKSYTLAPNQFMDLTSEEFKYTYLGLINQRTDKKELIDTVKGPSVNWVTAGAVTPVKDQGQCGSCWAFSAVACLEGADFVYTKVLGCFSEQQLVDCSSAYGNMGCNGGWMDQAFEYVIATGITTEQAYPYVAVEQTCKQQGGAFKISSYKDNTAGDCDGLKAFVTVAPTSVAVDAENWSFYSGGIFNDCGDNLDHGVLAAGFTDDYWLIKNSWGASWGEQGYIRLSPGDTCGICDAASQVFM